MTKLLAAAVLSVILMLCLGAQSIVEVPSEPKTKTIQIISTSDVHGKMLPYDYAKNREDLTGSLAQISTCIKQIRDDNTILIDLGDNLQGNFAQLYLDDAIHPIAHAQNMMGYDFFIPGNHEFNYGMEEVFEFVWQHEATFLCANLYYDNMENYRVFQPYAIVEKDGVRIGIIGVVTPVIMVVDFANLLDGHVYVTNPVTEIKQIAAEIRDDVDILIAACHMDLEDEPACYDLQQFLIDERYQGKGLGSEALSLLLSSLEKERRFDCVEVCVNKSNTPALRLFQKAGFSDTGYTDPELPDCVNLRYRFAALHSAD